MNRSISVRAVILGLLANIGSGFAAGIAVALVFLANVWLYLPPNATTRELMEAWATERAHSIGFQILRGIAEFFPAVVGGYVAARIAKSSELIHASIVGVASALVQVLMSPFLVWLKWAEPGWKWISVVYLLFSIAVSVLGGSLALFRSKGRKI